MYYTLHAILLFWKKLTGIVQVWGLELNPYDKYVANKMITGSQYIIIHHVNNLKISYVDCNVNVSIIENLNE